MIKYKLNLFSSEIGVVEITAETETSVRLTNGQRRAKITHSLCYFDTWREAHDYLLFIRKDDVAQAEIWLQSAVKRLSVAQAMEEPPESEI